MLSDVLDFAVLMLVDGGRLAMWMPTANDEDIELAIPVHPGLELIAVCVQHFNKCMSNTDREPLIPAEYPCRVTEAADL